MSFHDMSCSTITYITRNISRKNFLRIENIKVLVKKFQGYIQESEQVGIYFKLVYTL